MRVVYIKWLDASNYGDESRDADDPGTLMGMESVGFLVGDFNDRYSIAQYRNELGQFRYVGHIPKASVTEVREIEV